MNGIVSSETLGAYPLPMADVPNVAFSNTLDIAGSAQTAASMDLDEEYGLTMVQPGNGGRRVILRGPNDPYPTVADVAAEAGLTVTELMTYNPWVAQAMGGPVDPNSVQLPKVCVVYTAGIKAKAGEAVYDVATRVFKAEYGRMPTDKELRSTASVIYLWNLDAIQNGKVASNTTLSLDLPELADMGKFPDGFWDGLDQAWDIVSFLGESALGNLSQGEIQQKGQELNLGETTVLVAGTAIGVRAGVKPNRPVRKHNKADIHHEVKTKVESAKLEGTMVGDMHIPNVLEYTAAVDDTIALLQQLNNQLASFRVLMNLDNNPNAKFTLTPEMIATMDDLSAAVAKILKFDADNKQMLVEPAIDISQLVIHISNGKTSFGRKSMKEFMFEVELAIDGLLEDKSKFFNEAKNLTKNLGEN